MARSVWLSATAECSCLCNQRLHRRRCDMCDHFFLAQLRGVKHFELRILWRKLTKHLLVTRNRLSNTFRIG